MPGVKAQFPLLWSFMSLPFSSSSSALVLLFHLLLLHLLLLLLHVSGFVVQPDSFSTSALSSGDSLHYASEAEAAPIVAATVVVVVVVSISRSSTRRVSISGHVYDIYYRSVMHGSVCE